MKFRRLARSSIVSISLALVIGLLIGFLVWSNSSPLKIITIQSKKISVNKVPASVTWKIYSNPSAGYELDIPNYFKHQSFKKESEDRLTTTDHWYTGDIKATDKECQTTGEAITISVINSDEYENIFQIKPEKTIQVDKIKASEYIFHDWIAIEPIEYKGSVYKIAYIPPCDRPDGYKFPERLDDFHKMVKSLKFIE